ncbi:L-aspartate oxidase [Steroidobacter denitrificans]|uniref:L-aspartate oxidase n=1 Tax=Steroidobacter denitrificans TaxID=465721 RepID=A0A127FD96_STEDE|nr:L-aspartate oxidase [Steroidobacter denitrificans]AMN47581.1 L-aspartate oxidase [Steroidobacter denitrificans]
MTSAEADVLILGAGAAGLVTALNARARQVMVVTPDRGDGSSAASDLAQGGMAAAVGPTDSPQLHLQDTLRAGGEGVDVAAARLVCDEAAAAATYLESLGVRFARDDQGWAPHMEAAHSRARVLHVDGDATGAAIMHSLRQAAAAASHVETLRRMRAARLLMNDDGVNGVVVVDEEGRATAIRARAVVIATGGIGGLFARSTNPVGACGDGVAMALAAGARSEALEFVQFHPTALDVEARPLPLLTEALRGAGAKLVDQDGVGIMAGIHPLAELAPRDVVSRAVYAAQSAGRRVRLDATRLDGCDVEQAFPSAYRICRIHGIDPHREPIPVTPAVHYHMGGVAVDLEGRTSLPGLWAVGEAACTGMHGANRLASNSLLEAVVFGRRLGQVLSRERLGAAAPGRVAHIEQTILPQEEPGRTLREVMWRCMGVVRSTAGLAEGLEIVARLRKTVPAAALLDQARLLLAEHMLLAATRRTTSCGAHYRRRITGAGPGNRDN